MSPSAGARAKAHVNIAWVKYWGKSDDALNLPAVPSLSANIEDLFTVTEVRPDVDSSDDEVWIDGEIAGGSERDRVIRFLDLVRARLGNPARVRVHSQNNFPRAAGLAS
ncbi:MAG: diphosphomevalonate decarboxylase, partial [Myxococcales bacterium]|nr:diphosphomevalonate decarboxylase [Myxococcales bacterium]